MDKEQRPVATGLGERLWAFFASIRLAIICLSLLALTAVIGTLLPQGETGFIQTEGFGLLQI